MRRLRFITAGSVDDGKSTLIGRLLYETGAVLNDQLAALERSRIRNENGTVNLALLTDGLMDERLQGITIDIAWKYFATRARRFVIIDAPGHVQYTRNMVTGASHADLAVILIDARKGVIEQTRRHSAVAALVGIPRIVVAVNKLDLVNFDRAAFEKISSDYRGVAAKLGLKQVDIIPVSALEGDNVVKRSSRAPWYGGPTLLDLLEAAPVDEGIESRPARLAVQHVIRPQAKGFHDYRAFAGQVLSGTFRKGDMVTVFPTGVTTHIVSVGAAGVEIPQGRAPLSVALRLAHEVDASRGDWIVASGTPPILSQDLAADVCWLDEKPLVEGGRYLVRHGTAFLRASVRSLTRRWNLDRLEAEPTSPERRSLAFNELGRVTLRLSRAIPFDSYLENRLTGSMVLIDEASGRTAGAVMIREPATPDDEVSI
jgi:sulfate adenylyltransferase subunit 1